MKISINLNSYKLWPVTYEMPFIYKQNLYENPTVDEWLDTTREMLGLTLIIL